MSDDDYFDPRWLAGAYGGIMVFGFFGCILPTVYGGWGLLAWFVGVPTAGFVCGHVARMCRPSEPMDPRRDYR